jgi:NADH-quinone oxidoreductase subunit N
VTEFPNKIPVSFSAIAPEAILLIAAAVLLAVAVFLPARAARAGSGLVAAAAFVAAAVVSAVQFHHAARFAFDQTLRIDSFGQAARLIVFSAGLLTVILGQGEDGADDRPVEFHALLLTAAAGMSLLAVANSFVTLFVALELFSLALYVLVAIRTEREPGLEGAFKYLLIGSVGAAFLLYGSALVYGSTGQLEFTRIRTALSSGQSHPVLLMAGLALVAVGLTFKANAAPFHLWTPDAYQGAPTPVTAFMSASTKATALIAVMRVLVVSFPRQAEVWEIAVAAVAITSFVLGNLGALRQTDVKRMLAYSTIGHTGFLLTAVAADSAAGARALLYYLAVYAAMNVGAFALLAVRERELGRPVAIADFTGWGYRRPLLGAAMLVFMLSLAGFPPTGGFLGKLYIFSAAVQAGQTWLAIVGVVATMVALVYYLKIPLALYDRVEGDERVAAPVRLDMAAAGVTVLAAVLVLVAGVAPSPLLDLARTAGSSLFS